MIISGLQKTTLLDYPGHVAATVFLAGCNFRCPFCHNMNIVDGEDNVSVYSEDEILSFLNKRKGVLSGVCITGGEPTLNINLPDFIKKIKDLGYLVKLDTNGSNYKMLNSLVYEGLIDYVAMDVKTSLSNYPLVAGISKDKTEEMMSNVEKSISFLLSGKIEYEFRTTIVKQYHDLETMKEIGKLIKGAERYYLQCFTESEYVPDKSLSSLDKDMLYEYLQAIKVFVENAELRGIE